MKREFGKWLMDIAKYMAIALLISSIFGDMSKGWMLAFVGIATVATLLLGLLLVKNDQKTEN